MTAKYSVLWSLRRFIGDISPVPARISEGFEPDIVVLQLGSNDLCSPEQSVGNFTDSYHSVINELITEYGVLRVVVLQILHMLEPSRPVRHYVEAEWFYPRADDANITLRQLLKDNDKAILWNHKGFLGL